VTLAIADLIRLRVELGKHDWAGLQDEIDAATDDAVDLTEGVR
jgi:hypothetical protein